MRRDKDAIEWRMFDAPPFPPERVAGETDAFVRLVLAGATDPLTLNVIALAVMKLSATHITVEAVGIMRRRVARILLSLERTGVILRIQQVEGPWKYRLAKGDLPQ
jgi:hypothetical protein